MTASRPRILVVDDEPPMRRLLRAGLSTQGFEIVDASNGERALDALSDRHDLVILDLGLPGINGLDVLRQMRERGDKTPVLVLSSRTDEAGKVEAFDLGADDYVTKPFGMNELIARVRTALRHAFQANGSDPGFQFEGLDVDLVRRLVKRDGREVRLSPKEYDLLRIFVQNAGRVLTHAFLLHEVWGTTTDPQQLRVYIGQLRQKIERMPEQPTLITTEVGIGYRLRTPDL